MGPLPVTLAGAAVALRPVPPPNRFLPVFGPAAAAAAAARVGGPAAAADPSPEPPAGEVLVSLAAAEAGLAAWRVTPSPRFAAVPRAMATLHLDTPLAYASAEASVLAKLFCRTLESLLTEEVRSSMPPERAARAPRPRELAG